VSPNNRHFSEDNFSFKKSKNKLRLLTDFLNSSNEKYPLSKVTIIYDHLLIIKDMMKFSKLLLLSFVALTFILSSCKDDEMGGDACISDFNQKALFENVADNLILPHFQDFQTKVNSLETTLTEFTNSPTDANLLAAREAFKSAWLQWQNVAQYSFGPAEDVFLQNSLNNFPLDVDATAEKINNENTDFSSPDAYDKGFPALDYLLFGLEEGESGILIFYQNGTNYSNYLLAIINDIKERTDGVVAKWEGDYRTTFVSNTGTAAGTTLSLIINGLNQNYELIKREKLGVPSGVLTLGFANPTKVEARWAGYSTQLAQEALQATKDFYLGQGRDDINGVGLDDYLQDINALKAGDKLDDLIRNQFDVAIANLAGLASPLSAEAENNQSAVESAYAEVTKNLVNLKTDLPSVLCVSITYIDNPSDSD
jgi:predicted lipoprotein